MLVAAYCKLCKEIAVSDKVESLSTILAQKYKGKGRGRRSKLSLNMILSLYIESGSHGGFLEAKSHHDPIESGCQEGGFRATRKQLSYAPMDPHYYYITAGVSHQQIQL